MNDIGNLFYEESYDYLSDARYRHGALDKMIVKGINNLITEERGINETVRYNAMRLFRTVMEEGKKVERIPVSGFQGVVKRSGNVRFKMEISPNEVIDIKIPSKSITVNYTFYNFRDNECKRVFDEKDRQHQYGCECICNGQGYLNLIYLNFYLISGHADEAKWADSIQHELSHDFEQTNMGKPYNVTNLYHLGRNYLNSENVGERSVAMIIYMSDNGERKAYANGLYAYLCQKNVLNKIDYNMLRHSDYFKMLKSLNNSLAFIKENKVNSGVMKMLGLLREYNIGYNELLRKGDDAIRRWNKEAIRVIRKYKKDVQEKHNYWTDGVDNDYI